MSTHDGTGTKPPTYMPGERVHISFSATVAAITDDGSLQACLDGFNGGYNFAIPADATVQRQCPADGKPQPGDMWRDRNGTQYFTSGESLVSADGDPHHWTWVNDTFGPLILIYRPGSSVDHIGPTQGTAVPS